MSELTELTISEVSELLDRKSVSSVELVKAILERIDQTDSAVKAWAYVRAEQALEEAREADREIARDGRRGTLHGVPVGVKDIMYMKGIPNEAGSRVLAGFVPDHDATVVRRLREAGAILMGKTRTHEFAYGVNEPPTRNPWDPSCYPGGSSTGSGVSVSVRSIFGALGSDTGGSIRIPASILGIVGLKPTYGRVSSHGVIPLAWSLDHVGPLTRTVADSAHLLQSIAGYDPLDPGTIDHPVSDYTAEIEAGVEGMRIGIERDYFFYEGINDDVRESVEAVIETYRRLGAVIVEVELPEIALATDLLNAILLAEASTYHQQSLRERGDDYDPATRTLLELGELVPATQYIAAQRGREAIKRAVARLFHAENLDAMLWPTMPLTTAPLDKLHAPREDRPEETPMQSYVHHTFSANITAQPAISVPCGLSSKGLPIGFQLTGRPFDEATLFRMARAYERENSWSRLRPPLAG